MTTRDDRPESKAPRASCSTSAGPSPTQAAPQRATAVFSTTVLSRLILGWDNDDLKRRKVEVLDAPKVEVDERFMLRVHERFKEEGHTLDVVHLYRGIGLNLVGVMVAATTEDKAVAKQVHDAGALMLMSVSLGAADPKIVRPVKKE